MPEYSAQFIGPLVIALHDRLVSVANDYLCEINPDAERFVEYEEPVVIAPRFPALFVLATGSKIQQADDDSYLMQEHEIVVEYAITGRSAFEVQRNLFVYSRALDRAIRRMTQDDWYVVEETRGPVIWEVTAHDYVLRKFETALRGEGQLTVIIQHMER